MLGSILFVVNTLPSSDVLIINRSPSPNVQFVLASWEFPDEYGQGIQGFRIYENSTGSWEFQGFWVGELYVYYFYPELGHSLSFNWSVGRSIKLRIYTILNGTLTGATDAADGRNYHRHSVIVVNQGATIFTQQNFTYSLGGGAGPLYYYEYEVILNFLPDYGQIYIVTVMYEIFW